jgi:AraC family transcriptional regulator of arabinose operon
MTNQRDPERKETVPPQVRHLVTGHFRSGPEYSTWRPHGTQDWLLIYTLSGGAVFGHAVGAIEFHPRDLALLRPGAMHDYRTSPSAGTWELLWAHFHPRPHWIPWLDWPEVAPGLMRLTIPTDEAEQEILAQFFQAHRQATGAQRNADAFAMLALEEIILRCDAFNPRSAEAILDERVRLAMDYMRQNLGSEASLPVLAEIAGMSASRLSHLFREQVGVSPMRYLEIQRLDRAKQLLELTTRSVQSISAEVGFESPFYFTLRFKRQTGLSPRTFRGARGAESKRS